MALQSLWLVGRKAALPAWPQPESQLCKSFYAVQRPTALVLVPSLTWQGCQVGFSKECLLCMQARPSTLTTSL